MFEEFLLSCILESCCMYKLLMTWIWGEGGTWQLVDKACMLAMTFSFNAWEVRAEWVLLESWM